MTVNTLELWRRYEIDELGNRSIFRNFERLKIMNNMINEQLIIKRLVSLGHANACFPLTNIYELNGTKRFRKDRVLTN